MQAEMNSTKDFIPLLDVTNVRVVETDAKTEIFDDLEVVLSRTGEASSSVWIYVCLTLSVSLCICKHESSKPASSSHAHSRYQIAHATKRLFGLKGPGILQSCTHMTMIIAPFLSFLLSLAHPFLLVILQQVGPSDLKEGKSNATNKTKMQKVHLYARLSF